MESDADAELMLKVATGDKAAFAVIFDRYQASVARFAFRFVGGRPRAEELTQEIFIKLYRNAKSYRPSAKFKTFLFRLAANHCLNEVRRGEYQVTHSPERALQEVTSDAARPDPNLPPKNLMNTIKTSLSG